MMCKYVCIILGLKMASLRGQDAMYVSAVATKDSADPNLGRIYHFGQCLQHSSIRQLIKTIVSSDTIPGQLVSQSVRFSYGNSLSISHTFIHYCICIHTSLINASMHTNAHTYLHIYLHTYTHHSNDRERDDDFMQLALNIHTYIHKNILMYIQTYYIHT